MATDSVSDGGRECSGVESQGGGDSGVQNDRVVWDSPSTARGDAACLPEPSQSSKAR